MDGSGSTDDEAAYQLLGWNSSSAAGESAARRGGGDNDTDQEQWQTLHATVRTTAEGAMTFRRAMEVLSSSQIDFEDGGASDNHGGSDPLSIVKAHFRLIKCCLEPAAAAEASLPQPMSEDQWIKAAGELLKRMGDSLKTTIALSTPEDAKSSSSSKNEQFSQTSAAVLYYLQSTLQNIHPHIKNNTKSAVRLLGPSYRNLCDVADCFLSLLEKQKSRMDNFVTAFLPSVDSWETLSNLLQKDMEKLTQVWRECNGLLEQSAHCLLEFLDLALDRVQLALLPSGEGGGSNFPPDKQSKIIVFLFARVTSLVLMTARFQNSFKNQTLLRETNKSLTSCDDDDGKEGRKKLITSFFQRLIRVCGLSLVAQARLENATANDQSATLLNAVLGLRSKAELYLTKVLGDFDSSRNNADIISLGLECFVDLPSCDETGKDIMGDYLLAKVLLMKYVMKKLIDSDLAVFLPEQNAMIKFYQSVIFVDVPKCHHLFQPTSTLSLPGCNLQKQAREILSELVCVLENASHLLCRSEKSCTHQKDWYTALIQQHNMLIRWLAPAASTNHKATNHPMTEELLLSIIQRRITSSCAVDDHYSQQDASHFISLLAQLLFHQNTAISLRRNVATLLVRLLSTSSMDTKNATKQKDAKSLTIELLWSTMKKTNMIYPTSNKRKRAKGDGTTVSMHTDDVWTICWVLEALAKSSILTQSFDTDISVEMRQMWHEIMNLSQGKKKMLSRSRDGNRAMFLLSLSAGAVRASTNVTNFFLAFDSNGSAAKTISPKACMKSVIGFIELQMRSKNSSGNAALGNSNRHVLTNSVCIRLIGALAECVGRQLPENQVGQVGNMLKNAAVSSSAANATVPAFCLQYDAAHIVSKMSSVVQPGFGERSLQPLVECINIAIQKLSWYHTAPGVSSMAQFVELLQKHQVGIAVMKMPTLAQTLFSSRIKREIFSVATEEKIVDPLRDTSYSVQQESLFLLICCNSCNATTDSWYFLENNSVLVKSGSKVFVHRSKDGKVMAMVVAPLDGQLNSSSDVVSAIGSSNYDTHAIRSNSTMILDK